MTRIILAGACARAAHQWAVLGLAIMSLAIPTNLLAVLGGSEGSVQTDQVHMQAALRSTQAGNYTVHELRAPTGIAVREYASGGTVFGVAWDGPAPPDMQQLLGSYFDSYMQAREQQAQNGAPGRRPVNVELPGLVVHISGYALHFHGQAFVPDMVPQGVKAEEIR